MQRKKTELKKKKRCTHHPTFSPPSWSVFLLLSARCSGSNNHISISEQLVIQGPRKKKKMQMLVHADSYSLTHTRKHTHRRGRPSISSFHHGSQVPNTYEALFNQTSNAITARCLKPSRGEDGRRWWGREGRRLSDCGSSTHISWEHLYFILGADNHCYWAQRMPC